MSSIKTNTKGNLKAFNVPSVRQKILIHPVSELSLSQSWISYRVAMYLYCKAMSSARWPSCLWGSNICLCGNPHPRSSQVCTRAIHAQILPPLLIQNETILYKNAYSVIQ